MAVLAPDAAPARVASPLPRPPQGIVGKTASLPARPPARLVAESGIDGAVLAREVEAAQEASLAALRRRLSAVYRREADRFARSQMRALGDPYMKALESLYPAYRKKFEAYAEKRSYPAAKLAYAVGPRDPNPKDLPAPEGSTPLVKFFYAEASKARKELRELDAEFDEVVLDLLANIQDIGDDARAATFAAIEANRDALNRQALAEATLPLGTRSREAIRLTLAKKGIATVPAVAARSVSVPSTPALPAPPRVESPKALVDARTRLLGEARIWASLNGYRLDPKGRDATEEFARWKDSRVGASPNSPKSSAAP
ncbi:hypothetical protein EON82_00130 [bacterium]|nr:MAG: hypothetical protein EON82_00130 [bacterium]